MLVIFINLFTSPCDKSVLGGASGGGEGRWRDSILGIELEVAALERKNRKEDSVLGAHGKEKEGAWIAGQGERR